MLMLSLGFGLGVLAVVLAAKYERRKKARPMVVVYADSFANSTPRQRAQRAHDLIAQDSTLK